MALRVGNYSHSNGYNYLWATGDYNLLLVLAHSFLNHFKAPNYHGFGCPFAYWATFGWDARFFVAVSVQPSQINLANKHDAEKIIMTALTRTNGFPRPSANSAQAVQSAVGPRRFVIIFGHIFMSYVLGSGPLGGYNRVLAPLGPYWRLLAVLAVLGPLLGAM